MSDEELIKETMMLDYSQLVMHSVYLRKVNEKLTEEIKNKNKVVNDLLKRISNLEFEVEDKNRIINELEKIIRRGCRIKLCT